MTDLMELQDQYRMKRLELQDYEVSERKARNSLFTRVVLVSIGVMAFLCVIIALIFGKHQLSDCLQLIASGALFTAIFDAIAYEGLTNRFHQRISKRKSNELSPLRHEILHNYIDGVVLSKTPLIEKNHYRMVYLKDKQKVMKELIFDSETGEIHFVD